MNKNKDVPYLVFKDLLKKAHKSQADVDYLQVAMEYVLEKNPNMYNSAFEYADNLKKNNYFTEADKQKLGIK